MKIKPITVKVDYEGHAKLMDKFNETLYKGLPIYNWCKRQEALRKKIKL